MGQGQVRIVGTALAVLIAGLPAATTGTALPAATPIAVSPATLRPIARVDERFQSYNIETAEVIGGRFWAPYSAPAQASASGSAFRTMTTMFRTRDPIDLNGNRRLRVLAAALGPAYVRIGGRWANTVYFQDDDQPKRPAPGGFEGVLTRAQWAGVVDFAKVANAKVVTSFPVSPGARDASGAWNPDQARRLIRYTRSLGGRIAAAEVSNEPNIGVLSGLPKGYDAAAFARDSAAFAGFLHREAPEIRTIGPVSTGEAGNQLFPALSGNLNTLAMLSASPRPQFDIFAYHFYGAASERCAGLGKHVTVSPDEALSEEWLGRADQTYQYYRKLHDQFAPKTPIWITEEGEASCGGDRWGATFLDTFRYVDQLARMARDNVAVVFHNTLAASDYALIDDKTLDPRPSYWAALLWRRLMGQTVLDAGPLRTGLHVYAQCLRGSPGGVALVAINLDRTRPAALDLPLPAQRYSLTADTLQSATVMLNGHALKMAAEDRLPALNPARSPRGRTVLAPASITFLAMPGAGNKACRRPDLKA